MSNNIIQQNEEIEVLDAIFGDSWVYSVISNTYSIEISKNLSLHVTLHASYPSDEPPRYEVFAPCLSRREKEGISEEFQRIFDENRGQPIIFQWIEELKTIVEKQTDSEVQKIPRDFPVTNSNKKNRQRKVELNVVTGPAIVDRKSTFQAHVCLVTSETECDQFLKKLLEENRKLNQAKHNVTAFVVELPGKVALLQDCNDDGEKHAGSRLLHLMKNLKISNVMVVVTRWYGGIHLGPDRFKNYNNAARAALLKGGFIEK